MVARANGLLGGCLARESFTLSQGFFYCLPAGAHPMELRIGDTEEFIDQADELDLGALLFQPSPGAPGGAAGKPDYKHLDDTALADLIETGAHYFAKNARLSASVASASLSRWARLGPLCSSAPTSCSIAEIRPWISVSGVVVVSMAVVFMMLPPQALREGGRADPAAGLLRGRPTLTEPMTTARLQSRPAFAG